MTEERFHSRDVAGVFAEGVIVRNGFGFGVNQEFVGIATTCFTVESGAPLTEDFLELFLLVRGELLNGFDAKCAKGALGYFADARNLADREWREETGFHAWGYPNEAAWFGLLGGDFGYQAGGSEAAGTGKVGCFCDGPQEFVRGSERRAVQAFGAVEIEIGFVDGNHFHDRRKLAKDGGDAVAPFGIFFVMAVKKNGVGTKAASGAERHSGLNAEYAGFVAGGGNDATLIGAAADNNGLAAEVGTIKEFNGDEKGVHVDVEDRGVERDIAFLDRIVFGAEASQVWHVVRLRRWVAGKKREVARRRETGRQKVDVTVGCGRGPSSQTALLRMTAF